MSKLNINDTINKDGKMMRHKLKKQHSQGGFQYKKHVSGVYALPWFCRTTVWLFMAGVVNLTLLPGNVFADSDGLLPVVERCDGIWISGNRSGTCDSAAECDTQRNCPDVVSSCGFHATKKCQLTLDFDCDSSQDNTEYNGGADPTTSSITNPDHDRDLLVRNCDDDDDNDGILDGPDDCEEGDTGWTSNGTTDHDSDGCQDSSAEDPDDDNDGKDDDFDDCSTGDLGWTSNNTTDNDNDGCRDAGEDLDDDNDGDPDVADNCQLISNPDQANNGGDAGLGDACDPDMEGDMIANTADVCPLTTVINAGLTPNGFDADCDYICWRPHTGLPGAEVPPMIDGVIDGPTTVDFGGIVSTHDTDIGWSNAQRITFGNGTTQPHVAVQALRHKNAATDLIYLSFEVNNDGDGESAGDTIVVAFRPDIGSAPYDEHEANDVRITYDVVGGATTVSMHDGSNWNTLGALPAGMVVAKNRSPASGSWDVEMVIPTSGWVTFASDFKFYFNVVRASGGTATEFVWPDYAHRINGDYLSYNYSSFEWGIGTENTSACSGVYLNASDITTDNTPDNKIYLLTSNQFNAFVRNDSGVTANNVNATFRIADWGIADKVSNEAVWRTIPGTPSNPTGNSNVPAVGANFTMDWLVASGEHAMYDEAAGGYAHQCIYVELDSPSTVNFTSRSARRNMNVDATSSVFKQKAKIDARGLPKPPNGKTEHTFILQESRQVFKPVRIKDIKEDSKEHDLAAMRLSRMSAATGAGQGHVPPRDDNDWISQTQWLVHGYRETGNYIEIKKVKYPLIEPVASFGYVVTHTGYAVESWEYALEGGGIKNTADGVYRIDIPEGGFKEIITRVKAIERNFLQRLIDWLIEYWWLVIILLILFFLWYSRRNP